MGHKLRFFILPMSIPYTNMVHRGLFCEHQIPTKNWWISRISKYAVNIIFDLDVNHKAAKNSASDIILS